MSKSIYRVCVVGCGVICQNHLRPLSEMTNIQIVGVCDVLPERAQKMADVYHCHAYTDYHVMFETEKPDTVHICLPHYLHHVVTLDALQMGIDVLCEKPMDATLEGARQMLETANKLNRKLGIIFQNRYNTGSVLAKQVLEQQTLGRLIGISGTVMWHRDEAYYQSGVWRKDYSTAGGGVIINQAIHTLDLMRWLAGSSVSDVQASIAHHGQTSAEVEDTAEGVITFDNDVRALFFFSINNSFDDEIRVNIACEKGHMEIVGGRCSVKTNDGQTWNDIPTSESFHGAKAVYGTGHAYQIHQFYDEQAKNAVLETAEEALKTQALIHRIFLSAGREQ